MKKAILPLYGFGILMDWGYLTASAMGTGSIVDAVNVFSFGWIPAMFWPVHLTAEFWLWVL